MAPTGRIVPTLANVAFAGQWNLSRIASNESGRANIQLHRITSAAREPMNNESSKAWTLGNELREGQAQPRTQGLGHGVGTHRCRIALGEVIVSHLDAAGGAPATTALTHEHR